MNAIRSARIKTPAPHDYSNVAWWEVTSTYPNYPGQQNAEDPRLRVGKFIGQGRVMKYAGLAEAVMFETSFSETQNRTSPHEYDAFADRVWTRLHRRRPFEWFLTAAASMVLVLAEIFLAFMLAFCTPATGLGCWSGGFGLYAMLSSLSWFVAVAMSKPNRFWRVFSHSCNFVSSCWLFTMTMLIVSVDFCSIATAVLDSVFLAAV